MTLPIDPSRSALPPVAQFLAEAALQRQTSLLGADKAGAASPSIADTLSPQPNAQSLTASPVPNTPTPAVPDKASISAQAREQLGAGFDPRGGAVAGQSTRAGGASLVPLPSPLTAAPAAQGAAPAGAQLAAPVAGAAWPAGGLAAPLLRMVSALIKQLTQTPQGIASQRVMAAQPWPLELAHALESGAVEGDAPLLQTWLVRQGSVLTPDGARGFALTLRAPVAWLGGQAPPLSASPSPSPSLAGASPLLVPFAGNAASLQSGVLALVLQGAEASTARTNLTSALLVLDFQPQLPAAVYGRDMLQARLDPWTQMAVLQNSGQVPTEEERARHGAQPLCDTLGCPYVARATCVQPFCLQMRGVFAPEAVRPVGPVPLA